MPVLATGPAGGFTPSSGGEVGGPAGFGGRGAARGGATGRGETPVGARTAGARPRPRGAATTGWGYWWNANKWLQLTELNLSLRTGSSTRPSAASALIDSKALAAEAALLRKSSLAIALPALRRALSDSYFGNRMEACVSLGKCGDPAALPLLLQALQDSSAAVQRSALLGLGLLGRDEAEIWILSIARNDDSARPLLGITGAVDGDTRKAALLALGFLGGSDGRKFLDEVANSNADEMGGLRLCALMALGVRGGSSSAPGLSRIALDGNAPERVRAAAAVALGKLGDKSPVVLRTLLALLQDKKAAVVQGAAAALGEIGDSVERAAVVQALAQVVTDHSDVHARAFALMALAQVGGDQAVSVAQQELGRSGVLEGYAPLALALASRNTAHAAAARVALKSTCATARDDNVRAACWVALGLLRNGDATAAASMAESDAAPDARTGAVMSLGLAADGKHAALLANLLADDADAEIRHEAALGLALSAPRREASEALIAVLSRTTDTYEAAGCAYALGLCGANNTLEELSAMSVAQASTPLTRAWSTAALGMALDSAPVPRLSRLRANNLYWLDEPVLRALLQSL